MKRIMVLSLSFALLSFSMTSVWAETTPTDVIQKETKTSAEAQALVAAAATGDLSEVKRLHSAGVDLNSKSGPEQSTALHKSAEQGHIKIVGFLLDAGADVAQTDLQGNSVLMRAVKSRHLDLVKLLIQNGADLNAHNLQDETVLMSACSLMGNKDIVRYLLKKRSNPHASSKDGSTALHFAAASGADSALRTLILYDVDLNAQNQKGMTALMFLVGNADTEPTNRVRMAKSLIRKGATPDLKNTSGQTALDMAKASKDTGLISYLESL